ncbi:hypothetical protein J6S88_05520 [bacterium]|nr:hypothetical protein [bacterium]
MSEGVLPVSNSEPYYRNVNVQLVKKHAPHYAEAKEIIKSRMKSASQIEEQAYDYSITATKMRNKYLNELFDYVADIHKADIRKGKKHHTVSNYDVLELYQKINGYNEKEFCRMLRAKTPEGDRACSFKEINKMLDDSMVEHFRVIREQQAAAKAARQTNSGMAAPLLNSGSTEATGIIPRERALTLVGNTENPIKPMSEIFMERVRRSADAIMHPEENPLFPNFRTSIASEMADMPNTGRIRQIGISEADLSGIISDAEEVICDTEKGTIASEIGENLEESAEAAGRAARRIGKKGWIGIAIAVVALVTGIAIHNKNKKKAQNLNVNA